MDIGLVPSVLGFQRLLLTSIKDIEWKHSCRLLNYRPDFASLQFALSFVSAYEGRVGSVDILHN